MAPKYLQRGILIHHGAIIAVRCTMQHPREARAADHKAQEWKHAHGHKTEPTQCLPHSQVEESLDV
jgi:hypothetical protein